MIRYNADAHIFSSSLVSWPGLFVMFPALAGVRHSILGSLVSDTLEREGSRHYGNTIPGLLWEHREATLGMWQGEAGYREGYGIRWYEMTLRRKSCNFWL